MLATAGVEEVDATMVVVGEIAATVEGAAATEAVGTDTAAAARAAIGMAAAEGATAVDR